MERNGGDPVCKIDSKKNKIALGQLSLNYFIILFCWYTILVTAMCTF